MNPRSLLIFLILMTGLVWAQGGGGVSSGSAGTATNNSPGVKNMPYSADVITESTRILANGNRIHTEGHEREFRDSEGRTRKEHDLPGAPSEQRSFQHVTIMDPVQRVSVSFDSRTKIATIHHWSAYQLRRPVTFQANEKAKEAAMPPSGATPGFTLEDLGTMNIEGFTAKGNRVTQTVPAGKIGNDRPVTSITETWMSTQLQTIVLLKNDDPQSGQRTMRLVNIRTTEPDPSLFQVPPDYTVKDDQAHK